MLIDQLYPQQLDYKINNNINNINNINNLIFNLQHIAFVCIISTEHVEATITALFFCFFAQLSYVAPFCLSTTTPRFSFSTWTTTVSSLTMLACCITSRSKMTDFTTLCTLVKYGIPSHNDQLCHNANTSLLSFDHLD